VRSVVRFAARAVAGLTAVVAMLSQASGASATATDAGWVEARGASATVVSNAGEAVARRVSQQLDDIRALVQAALGNEVKMPRDPLMVLAVDGERSLRELLPQFWERRMARPAAASSPSPHTHDIALRVDVSDAVRHQLLLHEYLHVITRVNVPDAPAWLDEGLSEFWSTLEIRDDALEVGRPAAGHLKTLQSGTWISLADLVKVPRGGYEAQRGKEAMLYAQSWALVHYLLLKPPSPQVSKPVFAPTLPADVVSLERELKEYVRAVPFQVPLRLGAMPAPRSGQANHSVRVLPEAEALAVRANFVVYGLRPAASLPLASRALQLNPAEPLALEVMGVYYFLLNEHDTARTWFKRAVEASGASDRARHYYALLTAAERVPKF
jgi:hypothetical protein